MYIPQYLEYFSLKFIAIGFGVNSGRTTFCRALFGKDLAVNSKPANILLLSTKLLANNLAKIIDVDTCNRIGHAMTIGMSANIENSG